ncbi:MAG: cellulose biosynthesis cyclic di-GMP-binding regulatory protein BcsB [Chloroflexi bacterium]|nr:cellulose biosynthesis cyclic di-GMP-binding regulatory protein BcsB [Chloroflexota bacterium]
MFKKISVFGRFIFLVLFLLTNVATVMPQGQGGERTETFTLNDLTALGEIVLQGRRASTVVFAPLPEDWNVKRMTVRLTFAHSSIMKNTSTLTVMANDKPVGSVRLTPENEQTGKLDVKIPTEVLKGDVVALKFVGTMRIADDFCDDLNNMGNWVRISSLSTVEYGYEQLTLESNVGRLPFPFINTRSVKIDSALFVTPANPTPQEMIPMYHLASYFSSQMTFRGLNLLTLPVNEVTPTILDKYNLIWIGRTDRLPQLKDIAAKLPLKINDQGTFLAADSRDVGIIMLAASPWNTGRSILIITGATDTAVANAAKAIRQPEFAKVARGGYALVPTTPVEPATQLPVETGVTTFKTLGFPTETVSGIGKHTLAYTLATPNWRTPESLKMTISMAHSPFTSNDLSYLTLAINGIPQSGIYLNKDNVQPSKWTVTIPATQLTAGDNKLELTYELHFDRDERRCDEDEWDQAWGVIHDVTTVEAKFSDVAPELFLTNFPVPFDSGSLIVLPRQMGVEQRAAAFKLFNELGRSMGARARTFELTTADQVTEDVLRRQSAILLGRPTENQWVAAALRSAPLKFDGYVRSLDVPSLKLVVADTSSVGVLEIMASPWNKQKAVLIISGTDDKGVGLAGGILVDPKLDKVLKGDVAVADSTGFLTTLDSRHPTTVAAAPAGNGATAGAGTTTTTPSGPTLTITQIIIGLMLVIFVGALVVILVRRGMKR